MNPLKDYDFLYELDQYNNKELFAKIILLTLDEYPVYEFSGKITGGSINIDGASSLRRTCSLTMVVDEFESGNVYWGLKNKFKLEIGVKNYINPIYPEIIWFKQGIFVFTQLNENIQGAQIQISISGKDKMCLLNGEVGGALTAEVDFGSYDQETEIPGTWENIKIQIPEIIKYAVSYYGQEKLENIIINDIDSYAVELLEYRSDSPLYLLKDLSTNEIVNGTFSNFIIDNKQNKIDFSSWQDTDFDRLAGPLGNIQPKIIKNENKTYSVIKLTFGDVAGYKPTELTYPGDLIGKVGESLTSILDKIKNTFSNFEYFYDIDGKFVFQKKKNYINSSWNNLMYADSTTSTHEIYAASAAYTSAITYSFINNVLVTSYSNNPAITNLKNDFSIWGKKKSSSGVEIPIHMRYAIEKIPIKYVSYNNKEYNINDWDWRELIYQMAFDFSENNGKNDFLFKISKNNADYPAGITGYESFYSDLLSFWRYLYNPTPEESEKENYFTEGDYKYWNKQVLYSPENLIFWFDFMSTQGEMGKYAVSTIGLRTKAINDDKITAIYYKEVPTVLFIDQNYEITNENRQPGYTYLRLSQDLTKYFSISSRGKSAQDELDNLLYQHTYCPENITLSTIPIFYLQPNTRIYISDEITKVNGEYIVSKITIPLAYNGTSSITATKAIERIY